MNAEIAKYYGYSFAALAAGKGPALTFYNESFPAGSVREELANQPLQGRYKGACVGMKGDCKARKEIHGFGEYYQCTNLCDQCCAIALGRGKKTNEHSPLYYGNFAVDAGYTAQPKTHEDYIKQSDISPYVQFIPGVTKDRLFFDDAHIGRLGFYKDHGGSLVWEWLCEGSLGPLTKQDCKKKRTFPLNPFTRVGKQPPHRP